MEAEMRVSKVTWNRDKLVEQVIESGIKFDKLVASIFDLNYISNYVMW